MKPIAFFDVDKTLLNGYSGFYATITLVQRRLVRPHHVLAALFYRIIAPLYHGDVRRMYEMILYDLVDHPLTEVMSIGKECFEKNIRPKIFQDGIKLVEDHKRMGHQVVLLSSGPSMVIDHVADFLQVDQSYSNGPVVRDGRLQKELREPLCYQEGKLITAQQVAKNAGVDLTTCYYYADSIDDLSLLLRVGHPRPVNPDRELRDLAQQNGWEIRYFKKI